MTIMASRSDRNPQGGRPPATEIDEVVVVRLVTGQPVKANSAELAQAIEILDRRGLSARQVAERCGVTERSVQRHRALRRSANTSPVDRHWFVGDRYGAYCIACGLPRENTRRHAERD